MSNTRITITYSSEKLSAIQQFADKNSPSVEEFLREQLDRAFTKQVPAPVRMYIEGREKPVTVPKPKIQPKLEEQTQNGA